MKKPVVQQEQTGCGIASTAAIVGVSYREMGPIAESLGISAQDGSIWSDTAHVRTFLRRFGIGATSGEVPFRSWAALPDLALLSIKWHLVEGRPNWYWVVFRSRGRAIVCAGFKEALADQHQTDFGRMKPKWYIPVREI